MKTYQLSAAGRRTLLLLLLASLAIWAFALWSFRSTLNLDLNPLNFWSSLNATIEAELPISQIVPALLMLVLIVATPFLLWNLLEEWAASYTPTDEGLRFQSLGINIVYPWSDIQAIRSTEDDGDEPLDELLLTRDHTNQIGNVVLRFLHTQGYGRTKLPIYSGLADRDELVAEIRGRIETNRVPEDLPADSSPAAEPSSSST